jgi:uncharacterized protein YndB with AHSA1/START domain
MEELPKSQADLPPLEKTIRIKLPVEKAFDLFTRQVSEWWPLETHSVGGETAERAVLEGSPGGRFYEIHQDGTQMDWGQVLEWKPPRQLVLSFHPGRTADFAQRLEASFQPEGGGTRLTLVHSGWERLAEQAETERRNYDRGWDTVLARFAEMAAAGG